MTLTVVMVVNKDGETILRHANTIENDEAREEPLDALVNELIDKQKTVATYRLNGRAAA